MKVMCWYFQNMFKIWTVDIQSLKADHLARDK